MGRPPGEKTLVDRQLGRNRAMPLLPQGIPAGESFHIPNHSGISHHPEFIHALNAALSTIDLTPYMKKDGTTTTTASIPFALGASIIHGQSLQINDTSGNFFGAGAKISFKKTDNPNLGEYAYMRLTNSGDLSFPPRNFLVSSANDMIIDCPTQVTLPQCFINYGLNSGDPEVMAIDPSGTIIPSSFLGSNTLDATIPFYFETTTAPSTTATPVFTSYYGGNTKALGDPVGWIVMHNGSQYIKIPYYT